MELKTTKSKELHPQLPSGDWNGFYIYQRNRDKHNMKFMLEFAEGKVNGSGSDDVGSFTFIGDYDLEAMTCSLMKQYSKHRISYKGYIDENGIWGKWSSAYDATMGISEERFNFLLSLLGDEATGGFHIWPSARKFSNHEIEEKKKQEKKVVEMVQ